MVKIGRGALQRLQEPPLAGAATLLMLLLGIAWIAFWPAAVDAANLSYYSFAPLRAVLVALFALSVGLGLLRGTPTAAAEHILAVMMVAAASVPLEIASHAATAAPVPLAWLWANALLGALGQLAIGALLGVAFERLKLTVLAPLLVPLSLVVMVVVDISIGMALLNPMTVSLAPSSPFLVMHALLSLLLAALLYRRTRA